MINYAAFSKHDLWPPKSNFYQYYFSKWLWLKLVDFCIFTKFCNVILQKLFLSLIITLHIFVLFVILRSFGVLEPGRIDVRKRPSKYLQISNRESTDVFWNGLKATSNLVQIKRDLTAYGFDTYTKRKASNRLILDRHYFLSIALIGQPSFLTKYIGAKIRVSFLYDWSTNLSLKSMNMFSTW